MALLVADETGIFGAYADIVRKHAFLFPSRDAVFRNPYDRITVHIRDIHAVYGLKTILIFDISYAATIDVQPFEGRAVDYFALIGHRCRPVRIAGGSRHQPNVVNFLFIVAVRVVQIDLISLHDQARFSGSEERFGCRKLGIDPTTNRSIFPSLFR